SVSPVGDVVYLTELVEAYARVPIVDIRGKGLGEVPLPGLGAVGVEWCQPLLSTLPKGHPEKFLFTFSSLTVSPGLYCHTPGQDGIDTLQGPKERLHNAVVEDRWASSSD